MVATVTERAPKPELLMQIDIRSLEHLGLKMYNSLPAVIAEYVANSWDAKAKKVNVIIPDLSVTPDYSIIITDDGTGMNEDELNHKFLVVGRRKREEEGIDYVEVDGEKRQVIGRKGLGKIAGFGVAGCIIIKTVKDGGFVEFKMDYDVMQQSLCKGEAEIKTQYTPVVLAWGRTAASSGTEVRLTRLKRVNKVSELEVRQNLTRHFSVFSDKFVVSINGVKLEPSELKDECQFVKEYPYETAIDVKGMLKVHGWIGTMKDTVPPTIGRGIVVMARGKLIQEPTTFDVGGKGVRGQVALSYLVGEIHADFLDAEEDLISTGRRSVIWEQEPASALRVWLNEEIRKFCNDWVDKRKAKKMESVTALPSYTERIAKLPKYEKDLVDGILGRMAENEEVDDGVIRDFADFLSESVEYKAFLQLILDLEKTGADQPQKIMAFFRQWEVLDAIETIRIAEGRLKAIQKFQELLRIDVREVPTLHQFFVDNPWILDPTWNYVDDEITLCELLKRDFPDTRLKESQRRIDFLCLRYGNTINVIELKKPDHGINTDDLEQLEHYVDHVKRMQGTDPERAKNVVGYLIGGHLTQDARDKAQRLVPFSMFVRPYQSLREVAEQTNERYITVLKRKAVRITDKRLSDGIERLSKNVKAT